MVSYVNEHLNLEFHILNTGQYIFKGINGLSVLAYNSCWHEECNERRIEYSLGETEGELQISDT